MSKHVHADNIVLYGQDAQETPDPWLRWECKRMGIFNEDWVDCTDGDMHFSSHIRRAATRCPRAARR